MIKGKLASFYSGEFKIWRIFFSGILVTLLIMILTNDDAAVKNENIYFHAASSTIALLATLFLPKRFLQIGLCTYFVGVRFLDFYVSVVLHKEVFGPVRYLFFIVVIFFFFMVLKRKLALYFSLFSIISFLLTRYFAFEAPGNHASVMVDFYTFDNFGSYGVIIVLLCIYLYFYRSQNDQDLFDLSQDRLTLLNINRSLVHDLNNILFKLNLAYQLQSLKKEDNCKLKEIIDELNAYSRSFTKLMSLKDIENIQKEYVPISEISKKVKFIFEDLFSKKGIKLEIIQIEGKILTSSPILIYSILGNLLSNSLKFSKAGDLVELKFTSENDHFKITVKDQAGGISKQNLKRLNSRYKVLESSGGTAGESGSGLGLKSLKFFCHLLGHKFHVTTQKSIGTEFSILI